MSTREHTTEQHPPARTGTSSTGATAEVASIATRLQERRKLEVGDASDETTPMAGMAGGNDAASEQRAPVADEYAVTSLALTAFNTRSAQALPQPILPPLGINTLQQGELKDYIVQAARKMRLTGWGAHGRIEGMLEGIDYQRFWAHPAHCIAYDHDELLVLAQSMKVQGQLQPLIVMEARDPRPENEGGTGGDLLIIDGVKRYRAAPLKGIHTRPGLRAVVRPYTSFYDSTRQLVTAKLSQHELSSYEMGRLLLRLRLAYEVERSERLLQGESIEPFPTLDELAAMLGKSKTRISSWLRVAQQKPRILDLVDRGLVTVNQVEELLGIADEEQRVMAAEVLAQAAAAGTVYTQKQIRALVSDVHLTGATPGPDLAAPQQVTSRPSLAAAVAAFGASGAVQTAGESDLDVVDTLYLPQLTLAQLKALPLASRMGYAVHDAVCTLRAAADQLDDVPSVLTRTLEILEHPDWQEFLAQLPAPERLR